MKRKYKKLFALSGKDFDHKVVIEGTEYDRRRKLTDKDIKNIKKLFKKNYTISEIAEMYNVSYHAIRYHVDDDFREKYNRNRVFYGDYSNSDMNERVRYKKYLIMNNSKLKLRKS